MLYVIPGGAATVEQTPTFAAPRPDPNPPHESVWLTVMMIGVLATVLTGMAGAGLTLHHALDGHLATAAGTALATVAVSRVVFTTSGWLLDRTLDWSLR